MLQYYISFGGSPASAPFTIISVFAQRSFFIFDKLYPYPYECGAGPLAAGLDKKALRDIEKVCGFGRVQQLLVIVGRASGLGVRVFIGHHESLPACAVVGTPG